MTARDPVCRGSSTPFPVPCYFHVGGFPTVLSHPPFPLGADIILTVFSSLACGTSMHGVASPMQPSIVYQVPLVRAYQDRNTCLKIGRTSLPPARQCHSDRLIPTLRWMLTHPLLPVEDKIRGAYPALILRCAFHSFSPFTLHQPGFKVANKIDEVQLIS